MADENRGIKIETGFMTVHGKATMGANVVQIHIKKKGE